MSVLLVRHARAGERGSVDPDHARPLDDVGWRQAGDLPAVLAPFTITRLLTSPFTRCVQTLEPLARATAIEIEHEAALAEGATPDQVRALLDRVGTGTVLCSHGDLIPIALALLAASGTHLEGPPGEAHPALDGVLTWPKASTWVLEGASGHYPTARYLPPPG